MAAVLSRTRSILERVGGIQERTYLSVDEETDVVRRRLYLDLETFQDLGEPETVTITVEPGDTLN